MIINNKRALAYTARVSDIKQIEGADNIELAHVGGWPIIVKKNEFKDGDLAVFFEIDSKLPEEERYAFLEKKHYKIKTMKLNKFGVFSQGLLMPMADFPELNTADEHIDLTDILKVKYAEPEDNARKGKIDPNAKYTSMKARHKRFFSIPFIKKMMRYDWFKKLMFFFLGKKKDTPKAFPSGFPFVHKTDEERVENIPWVLEDKSPLIVTEKLDGTSCTYILERKKDWLGREKFEFYVSSRNVRQLDPEQECFHESNIYWELAKKYDIENNLRSFLNAHPEYSYVCIQGEGVGNVQGNPLKLKEDDLYVFNFIDSINGRYSSTEGEKIINEIGMKWVPILDTHYRLPDSMEEFKEYANGKSVVNPNVIREGIVLRNPKTDLSFKNVSREYLLKH